MSSEMLLIF